MRKIHRNKVTILSYCDSVTRVGRTCTFNYSKDYELVKFWFDNSVEPPEDIYLIEDGEDFPKPKKGWSCGWGWIC
jgi:hypothetical protein